MVINMVSITLYEGDCIKVHDLIPDSSIDLILTDPPYYEKFRKVNNDKIAGKQGKELTEEVSVLDFDSWKYLFRQWYRILKPEGQLIVFLSPVILLKYAEYIKLSKLTLKMEFTWLKPYSTDFYNYNVKPPTKKEVMFLFSKNGSVHYNTDHRITDVLEYPLLPTAKKIHPFEKPIALLTDLIGAFSWEGQTVLDSFAGSGSVLESALQLNRNSIGIEISPKFSSAIQKRLSGRLGINYQFKKVK